MSSPLTLSEAAERLGVHYMTAYRYVRHGLLPATKVAGTWQVEADAVERFAAGEGAPVDPGRRAPWHKRLEDRLVTGDAVGAWGVADAALAAGCDLDSLYLDVISPAMVSIGARWAKGELDIAIEHQASGIVMRMIGRLGHRFVRPGRSRGTVVLGAVAGEAHGLPVAILADLVRMRGWHVVDLGADVPAASFIHAAQISDDVVAAGISVSRPTSVATVEPTCHAIRRSCPGVMIVLGGRAIESDEHAVACGADGWADSGAALHARLEAWTSA